jgi:hypothetical protein
MTPQGMGPQGRLGVQRRLPRWHALRKNGLPNVCRGESSGAPDDNLPVNLVPLEYGTGPKAELAANFSRDGDLSLGGQAGIYSCHANHITRVMNCWSRSISSVLSQKGLSKGRG